MAEGSRHDSRGQGEPSNMPGVDPGRHGGGTYTNNSTEPTLDDYANVFGPSARDIKSDLQRYKRHGRWHLPDALKGPNQWLTDRVDGLITDATNSPFTTKILPYKYIANPDAKLKWNVWSFDEGMASRVPYESAARTLTQTKRSFAGYTVRQGLAIVLEHNFMMSEKGRENFKNQLQQLVGSIQYTNDLDVHVALVLAPSYQKTMKEKYYIDDKSPTQICREFVDLFGFMQKNTNALDILIEEAKAQLKSWGGPMPDFLLCNSKLTFQLTMTPEKTNYLTQGLDGVKRLRTGPDIASYRGLSIVHSRCFSMDPGTPPRDILRRRVRVAEYYRIPPHSDNWKREFNFYNEERDTWFTYSFKDLLEMAHYNPDPAVGVRHVPGSPGALNHVNILEAARHLDGLATGTESTQSTQSTRPTLGADAVDIPRPMGGEFLGMQVDHLLDHTQRDLLSKVIVAAADSSWANWAPEGDFISEDMIFAVGAMSWNKFYVRSDSTVAGGGLPVGALRTRGGAVYIPPEKFYFKSIDPVVAGAPTCDYDMDATAQPYGVDMCKAYRAALKGAVNPHVKEIGQLVDKPYSNALVLNAATIAVTNAEIAYQEQCKISTAILFESVCEYPRIIDDFYNNHPAVRMTGRAVAASFIHGSNTNVEFAQSIRFRNWMRYGVAFGLFSKQIHPAGGVAPFTYPMDCMDRNRNCFTMTDGAAPPAPLFPTTFMPWNKVVPSSHMDANFRDPAHRLEQYMYSLFDISRGTRSHVQDANIPGTLHAPCQWKSSSVFENSLDDGLAFLREPGAFLSPNHFHPKNDVYEYSTVGSFIGANIILTREMIQRLLSHDQRMPAAGVVGVNGGPFLENTLLLHILHHFKDIKAEHLTDLYNMIKRCHESIKAIVNPPAPPPPAPGVAPPPAPAIPVLDRIAVTDSFVNVTAPSDTNDLETLLGVIGRDLGYTQEHTRLNAVWTWPYVSNSIDDIWTQPNTDYRLMEPGPPVAPGAPAAAPVYMGGNIPARFPAFAVGGGAINHWHAHANDLTRTAGCTAPNGHLIRSNGGGNEAEIVLNPAPLAHGVAANVWHRNWAFGRPITTQPKKDVMGPHIQEVKAFFYQIYSRLMFDQSEPPYIHHENHQYNNIVDIARDPFRLPKVNAPFYRGTPGGMFAGRIGNIGPMQGGPHAAWPNAWPGPAPGGGGPAWPGGPEWQGGPPRGGGGGDGGGSGRPRHPGRNTGNIELVIVRPNIEHYMLGVIMGQGGEGLGNTLWGQTEMACYDDSMHGIWGLQYKYPERAIVFNEKNLVRLWDVAYDGYCGGKDATFVNWRRDHGREFKLASQNMSTNYRGPSMMVMAFAHDQNSEDYREHCKRNWPSPVVFHDNYNYDPARQQDQQNAPENGDWTLTADPGNIHVVNYKDMRVFNNPLYSAYEHYRNMMPDFTGLHSIRKPAGASTVENETFCDSLAFQGTMRITELGREVEHIQGSGHHGPDWVGVASIRSGKGYKAAGAPSLQRLV